MKSPFHFLFALAMSFVLATSLLLSCGGNGGGGNSGDTNTAPVANAGPDQNVSTGSIVTLDGSSSSDVDGDALTYAWLFAAKPGSSTAMLSDPTVVNPTFTPDDDGEYVIQLLVNDGTINSVADMVTITASSGNSAPMANAGPNQNVTIGALVTLDGSGSSDVNGDTVTYSWSFTSNPGSATLTNETTVNPTFTPSVDGTYVVQLVVNDGTVDSAADTVTITASTGNSAPVANAGPDQVVTTASLVTLDGSNSSDTNGDTLTYSWSFASPSGVVLSEAITSSPTFTPDVDGTYVVQLVVNDGTVDSAPDTVTIIAEALRVFTLPDTGQSLCSDDTGTTITCAGTGQDGEISINPMSFTNNGDETVTDNVTSLMWQWKDDNASYTWLDAGTYCAGLPLAGYNDWRLPTKKELLSISDYGTYDPSIDITAFPNTDSVYWTSTTTAWNSSQAWYLYYLDGFVGSDEKTLTDYVRCVRGPAAATPSFTDNGDSTVTDNVTGLMWQKEDDNATRTWQQALDYCNGFGLAGYDDWLLPNVKELESIVDDTASTPAINAAFPNTDDSYWSSTSYTWYPDNAHHVRFDEGAVSSSAKSSAGTYVRCVR